MCDLATGEVSYESVAAALWTTNDKRMLPKAVAAVRPAPPVVGVVVVVVVIVVVVVVVVDVIVGAVIVFGYMTCVLRCYIAAQRQATIRAREVTVRTTTPRAAVELCDVLSGSTTCPRLVPCRGALPYIRFTRRLVSALVQTRPTR
jgi:hypothetical protein